MKMISPKLKTGVIKRQTAGGSEQVPQRRAACALRNVPPRRCHHNGLLGSEILERILTSVKLLGARPRVGWVVS